MRAYRRCRPKLHSARTRFTQYIETIPIMDLCMEAEQRLGTRMLTQWWYQECLDLEGVRIVDRSVELEEREG